MKDVFISKANTLKKLPDHLLLIVAVQVPGCSGSQEGPCRPVGRSFDRRSSSASKLQVSVWIRGAGG